MTNAYTKTGAMHTRQEIPCQDAVYAAENANMKIIVQADGVSACENSHIGAAEACKAAAEYVLRYGAVLSDCNDEKLACLILEEVVYALEEKAKALGVRAESLSSTLSFCCVHKRNRHCLVFRLGDGGVYLLEDGKADHFLSPDRGHTVSTMTRGAYRAARIRRADLPGQAQILLCSDGVTAAMDDAEQGSAIRACMASRDFEGLKRLLDRSSTPDDCCFIVL
jgi:serine/threonine protein phosphatase PrpC